MKNKITLCAALLLLLTIGFGCSFIDKATSSGSSDNSTTTNPSNSSTNSSSPNDPSKTGVAECDEFLDLLTNEQKKPDEDFVTRKIREYAIDFAKESIKKNIEENKGDKTKIAQGCREAKDEYLKKKDEKNKDNPNNSEKNKPEKKEAEKDSEKSTSL
jgi:hypothetical protein